MPSGSIDAGSRKSKHDDHQSPHLRTGAARQKRYRAKSDLSSIDLPRAILDRVGALRQQTGGTTQRVLSDALDLLERQARVATERKGKHRRRQATEARQVSWPGHARR